MADLSNFGQLQALEQLWKQYPGRGPQGTGPTGLLPNDALGWTQMLNDQAGYMNAANELAGKSPLNVRGRYPADEATPAPGELSDLQVEGGPFAPNPTTPIGGNPAGNSPWSQMPSNARKAALQGLQSYLGSRNTAGGGGY